MAQGSKKGNSATSLGDPVERRKSLAPPGGVGNESMPESDDEMNERDDDLNGDEAESGGARERPTAPVVTRKAGGGFFDIYKPNQGGRVRWGTGISAGVLLLWGVAFIYDKFNAMEPGRTRQILQVGVCGALLIGLGLAIYAVLARSVRAVDFLIGTEGEMKKVHWSSSKEVIGSTKVVIFVLLFLAAALFLVDLGLMLFFTEINVLRVGKSLLQAMFGKTS